MRRPCKRTLKRPCAGSGRRLFDKISRGFQEFSAIPLLLWIFFTLPSGVAAFQPAGAPELQPGDYAERARREFDAGRVAQAISVLDQFRERYPSGSDEVWWLYGQFYEANGPSRDIRSALDYYRRLIRDYPQSRRYNDARRRIAYLERYYINIQ
jgi:tetratricopeptide (TPR) repeat protein